MDCSPPGSSVWDFPGKNTGEDCNFLLQGIFPTQGTWDSLLLSHQGSCPALYPHYLVQWKEPHVLSREGKSQGCGSLVAQGHMLITEPITVARAQKVLIGWSASLSWRDGS